MWLVLLGLTLVLGVMLLLLLFLMLVSEGGLMHSPEPVVFLLLLLLLLLGGDQRGLLPPRSRICIGRGMWLILRGGRRRSRTGWTRLLM